MSSKTERFEMRLDPETLDKIDDWRNKQAGFPSRAEAIRTLVNLALFTTEQKRLSLTDGEKLILMMLCEQFKHQKIKSDVEAEFVAEVIHGGHYWGLKWEYPGIFHDHEDSDHIRAEVIDVLDMWSFLESAYTKLSKKDKERLESEAAPLGKSVRFPGFDGNNESEHLHIAHFLIDSMGRFESFKGRDLNSHMPSIESYRRMLKVFLPIRNTLIGRELGISEIIEITKARIHPDARKA